MGTTRIKGRPKDEDLIARRQEEILKVATRLFAAGGFDGTDLQHVADEAGVGKGTLYRYFENKERMFLAAVDRAMHALTRHINEAADAQEDPLDQTEAAVCAYLAFFDAHPEYVELIVLERAVFRDRKRPTYFVHRDANIGRWLELLVGLVAAGRVRAGSVEELSETISDLLYGSIFINHFAGRREPLEDQARRILDILYFGMLSDDERRRRSQKASGSPVP